ncbi:uncharacterized protein LOC134188809 [Corticium candelabrum]|uniref:uncharacterized protein LOC134188809 n=1 Tax=Corticium candelabrum TaxID=121492 RepID=UPI002E2728A2|nr:uncharacterized protein LOC134188809 [Corticium candelabrum]
MKLVLCILLLAGISALGNGQFKSGFDQLVPKFSDAGKLPQHMAGDHDAYKHQQTQQQKQYEDRISSQRKMLDDHDQNTLFKNPANLAKQKLDYLDKFSDHVVGNLPRDTLKHLTGDQLKHQVPRLRNFSNFGFANFVHNVDRTAFESALGTLKANAGSFSKGQARATVQKLTDIQGKVSSWDSSSYKNLGDFRKGMTCQQTSSMKSVAFTDDSIAKGFRDDAKSDKLDKSQRKGVVESKKREKPPQNWNKDDVKQLGHMMSDVGNHDLKELPDKTVADSIGDIGQQKWNDDQARTLISKFQSGRGKTFKNMTSSDVDDMKSLRNKFSTEQNKQLPKDAFHSVAEYVGKMGSPKQGTTQTTAERYFGDMVGKKDGHTDTSKLKSMHLSKTPKLMAGLSVTQLKAISGSELQKSLPQTSQYVGNLDIHQAKAVVDKVKHGMGRNMGNDSKSMAKHLRGLGSYIAGMKSSDVDMFPDDSVKSAVVDNDESGMYLHKGLKYHVHNALPSMQRKLAQKTQKGGSKKLSELGSDLAQHVSLKQMKQRLDKDTVDDENVQETKFTKHQNCQLFGRLKKSGKLGETNSVDGNNQTKWTGRTIRDKVGCLLTGASPDDLKMLPVDSIPDAAETVGKCNYTRKQGKTMVDSFRMQLLANFSEFDSSDVASFGPMVDQLYGKDLDDLRKGENGRSNMKQVGCQLRDKDMSKTSHSKRNDLYNRVHEALTKSDSRRRRDADELTADTVDKLGNLMSGIDTTDISKLTKNALETKMRDFSWLFNGTQRKTLADHVVRQLGKGSASRLTGAHLSDMGPAIHNLTHKQLGQLNPSAVADSMDDLRNRNWDRSDGKIMLDHAEKVFNKSVDKWNGNHFRRVKNMNIGHKNVIFRNMTRETLEDSLSSFPIHRMDEDQKQALRDAAKMKLGGDSEDGISEDHLVLLGSAANGDTKFLGMNSHFADSERSIDVLGHNSGKALDKSTATAGFSTIKSKRMMKGKTPSNYDSTDISNMGEFITGASKSDIDSMNSMEVAQALPRLGKNHYQNMDKTAKDALRRKASRGMSDDGSTEKPASQWSAAEAGERGTLVGPEDTQRYKPEHMEALSDHTYMNMDSDSLKAIPTDSLKEVSNDQARIVQERPDFTSLSQPQQDAINSAAMQDSLFAPEGEQQATPTDKAPSGSCSPKVGIAVVFTLIVTVAGLF